MKYKIKVKVSLDGSSRFYPMRKRHWWSGWEEFNRNFHSFETKEEAEKAIEIDIAVERKYTVDHCYDIEYKEKEIKTN